MTCRGTWAPRVVGGSGESLNFDEPSVLFFSTTDRSEAKDAGVEVLGDGDRPATPHPGTQKN